MASEAGGEVGGDSVWSLGAVAVQFYSKGELAGAGSLGGGVSATVVSRGRRGRRWTALEAKGRCRQGAGRI